MADDLKLPASGTEGTRDVSFTYKKQTIALTLTDDLVATEIRDQVSLKKPARKAILRATEKKLAKSLKTGFSEMGKTLQDDTRWNLFILLVNDTLADRHVAVREDTALAAEIAGSAAFQS